MAHVVECLRSNREVPILPKKKKKKRQEEYPKIFKNAKRYYIVE
jgi:hypothetical protein